jgi:DNA-binding MarR family transcriptional regulator
MSDVKLPEEIFDKWIYLSSVAKVVLVVLYRFRGKNGEANRSQGTIAEHAGLSGPQVSAGLRELEHFGWIVRKKGYPADNYNFRFPYAQTD